MTGAVLMSPAVMHCKGAKDAAYASTLTLQRRTTHADIKEAYTCESSSSPALCTQRRRSSKEVSGNAPSAPPVPPHRKQNCADAKEAHTCESSASPALHSQRRKSSKEVSGSMPGVPPVPSNRKHSKEASCRKASADMLAASTPVLRFGRGRDWERRPFRERRSLGASSPPSVAAEPGALQKSCSSACANHADSSITARSGAGSVDHRAEPATGALLRSTSVGAAHAPRRLPFLARRPVDESELRTAISSLSSLRMQGGRIIDLPAPGCRAAASGSTNSHPGSLPMRRASGMSRCTSPSAAEGLAQEPRAEEAAWVNSTLRGLPHQVSESCWSSSRPSSCPALISASRQSRGRAVLKQLHTPTLSPQGCRLNSAPPGSSEPPVVGSSSSSHQLQVPETPVKIAKIQGEQLSRLQDAFRRFKPSDTPEMSTTDVGKLVVHVGYVYVSEEVIRTVVNEFTHFSTVSFSELIDIVELVLRRAHQHFRQAFDKFESQEPGRLQPCEVYKLAIALGMTPFKRALQEAIHKVDSTGSIDFKGFLRVLEAYRMSNGFTQVEVDEIRRSFERFSLLHKDVQQVPASSCKKAFEQVFGQNSVDAVKRAVKDLDDGTASGAHGLQLAEFLVWARRVREEEVSATRSQFCDCDRDGDGLIDYEELCGLLRILGYTPLRKLVEDILAQSEGDIRDGLDFNEFLELMSILRQSAGFTQAQVAELRSHFVCYDRNQTHEVSCMDLIDLLQHLGLTVNVKDVRDFIRLADFNESNTLDFAEFLRLMRLLREQELSQVVAVFQARRDARSNKLPAARVQDALAELSLCGATDAAPPDAKPLEFEDFVILSDDARRKAQTELQKHAGFSHNEVCNFREAFANYDVEGSGTVEKGQMARLFADLGIPLHTSQDREKMLAQLAEARDAALRAGVPEEEVCSSGGASVRFAVFLHLLRMMQFKVEKKQVERDTEAILQTKFSSREVADFGQIFKRLEEQNGGFDGMTSDSAEVTAPSSACSTSSGLSLACVLRMMMSLGLKMTAEERAQLEKQFDTLPLNEDQRINFAEFLHLMRWMTDVNFAKIGSITARQAVDTSGDGNRRKHERKRPGSFATN